jgi:hypothetical protein
MRGLIGIVTGLIAFAATVAPGLWLLVVIAHPFEADASVDALVAFPPLIVMVGTFVGIAFGMLTYSKLSSRRG